MVKTPQHILEKIEEVRKKKLTELNLRGEELTEVPPEVFELDWLEILDLRCQKWFMSAKKN